MPITITPAQANTISAIISANPLEDIFEFDGDYVISTQIDPVRDDITLRVASGGTARFLGAVTDITGRTWSEVGSTGIFTSTETHSPTDSESDSGRKQADYIRQSLDYAVWFDGELGRHMNDDTDLVVYSTSGQYQFYLDDASNLLYINVDPATLTTLGIATSTFQVIKSNTADNLTIDGITFERFITDYDQQAVDLDGVDAPTIINCTFQNIFGGAVGVGSNAVVHSNTFQDIGNYAIGVNGTSGNRPQSPLIYNNTIRRCNLRGSATSHTGGFTKIAFSDDAHIYNNLFEGVWGVGLDAHALWLDIDNITPNIHHNVFKNITASAVYYEISGGDDSQWYGKIHHNVFYDCNREVSLLARRGGVILDNSANMVVYKNNHIILSDGGYAIAMREGNRGSSSSTSAHEYANRHHHITHNTVWSIDNDARFGGRDYYDSYATDMKSLLGDTGTDGININHNVFNHAGSTSDAIFSWNNEVAYTLANFILQGAGDGNTMTIVSSGDDNFNEPPYYASADQPSGDYNARIQARVPAIHLDMQDVSPATDFTDYGYIANDVPVTSGWTLNQTGEGQSKIASDSDGSNVLNLYSAYSNEHFQSRSWSIHIKLTPDSFDNGSQKLFQIGTSSGSGNQQAYMRLQAGGDMRWLIGMDGNGDDLTTVDINSYDDGDPHWFSFEFDDANNQVLCLIDFVSVGTVSSVPSAGDFSINSRFNVGGQSSGTAKCAGLYEHVVFFDRVTDSDDHDAMLNYNIAPTIDPIADVVLTEGDTVNHPFTYADVDGLTGVTASVTLTNDSPAPSWVDITDNGDGTGTVDLTPDYTESGVINLRVTVSDGEGGSSYEDFQVTVNNNPAPVWASIGNQEYAENSTISTLHVSVTNSDETATLTNVSDGGATLLSAIGLTFTDDNDNTGTITGTLTGGAGNYTIRLRADDGVNPAVDTTFTLTINEQGTWSAQGTVNVTQNEAMSLVTVTFNDSDNTALLTGSGEPTGVTFTDIGSNQGTLSGTPTASAGTYPITVTADDGVNPPVDLEFDMVVSAQAGDDSGLSDDGTIEFTSQATRYKMVSILRKSFPSTSYPKG